jgi:transposase
MSEPLHLLGQQLTPADWSATPESVKWSILVQLSQQINQLEQANQQLRTRVTELEERLNRNSKNSSQPPSQDAPQAKSGKGDKGGFGKSNRPPQTRRTRQQPQHPLSPPEACQAIHEQIPSNCSGCGHPLSGEDEHSPSPPSRRPAPIIPAVTEYRLHRLTV